MTPVATAPRRRRSKVDRKPSDEASLFRSWKAGGDRLAREALIREYTPLSRSLARRYGRSSEPFDDLVRSPRSGCSRRSTASTRTGAPLLVLRRADDPRRDAPLLPRLGLGGARAPRRAGAGAEGRARPRSGSAASSAAPRRVTQLAEYLEIDAEEVLDALEALARLRHASRSTPRGRGGEEDTAPTPNRSARRTSASSWSSSARPSAPRSSTSRRATGCSCTCASSRTSRRREIAERVGVSQMQVSRLLRRCLDQLRELTEASDEASGLVAAGTSTGGSEDD